eukprot:1933286-Rhodomonas_salina.2
MQREKVPSSHRPAACDPCWSKPSRHPGSRATCACVRARHRKSNAWDLGGKGWNLDHVGVFEVCSQHDHVALVLVPPCAVRQPAIAR